ncbi:histamine H3 receptor-like [Bombina bombina]|uniref:histamine H3 receptor-like n=1 Tax=Bombina bombina TaxID=8345 RepID=UPI00235A5035|nr:histamine H3 receptor-like [Bombina bombina]
MFLHSVHFGIKMTLYMSGNITDFSTANSSLDDNSEKQLTNLTATMVLLLTLVSLLICITVLGNTLVILVFIVDNRLKNQSNFFLLNLAICDFFIGAFCIPLYIPYLFSGKWMLGNFLCKLWLIVDNLMCTASAFNIVLISYDRFLAVTMAVLYRAQQKKLGQTIFKMALVWILSFMLYSPAILFWAHVDDDISIPDSICVPGYFYSWYFLLGASVFDFLLPLISISFFNVSIYWNIKTRSKKKRLIYSVIDTPPSNEQDQQKLYIISGNIAIDGIKTLNKPTNKKPNLFLPIVKKCLPRNLTGTSKHQQKLINNIHIIKLSHDKEIARSLAILVCIFGICWAPYSLLMSIRAACHDHCIELYWYEVTFWLLWVNSSINPILYPLCHKHFRKALFNVVSRCGQHILR